MAGSRAAEAKARTTAAMVGATSEEAAASAVLPNGAPKRCSHWLVSRLAVVAKEVAVMTPEGMMGEVGALGARGGLARAVREVVVAKVARAEVTAAVVLTSTLPC